MNLSAIFSSTKPVKRVLARVVACSLLLGLSSCGIPPLRLGHPGPPLPPSFEGAASPINSAKLGIKDFFNDPVLTHLIDQALAGNRELGILNEEAEVARNEFLARSGAFLPFVSFGARVGWDRYSSFTLPGASLHDDPYLPNKHFPNPIPDFRLGPNFLIPLDIWRELRNARDAAWQRFLAAIERRNDFVIRLVAEVAENYFGLMALDQRLDTLDRTITVFQQSLKLARARFEAGRGTTGILPVRRFEAEVRKNQSEKLVVRQEIVEVENRINFLANRFPQPVERLSARFFDLNMPLSVGVPAQLLQNRPDIRRAERELVAAGLDVKVARAHFFPRLDLNGGIGYEAFNPKYLFWTPASLVGSAAAELTAPLINKRAIRAEYRSANARQLEAVYNYQRVVLNAFTEVVNRLSRVQNYSRSIQLKQQQLEALRAAVNTATNLFQRARVEYIEVLLAQRDRLEARTILIQRKREQLVAIVNTYQALGGGLPPLLNSETAALYNKRSTAACGLGVPQPLPNPDNSAPGGNDCGAGELFPGLGKLPDPDTLPGQLPEPRKLPEPEKPRPGVSTPISGLE